MNEEEFSDPLSRAIERDAEEPPIEQLLEDVIYGEEEAYSTD